jgi:hypothetical protein
MKKAMLLALATLFVASSLFAEAPGQAYIGVYGDEGHSVCSVNPALYTPFDVWIWILPGYLGVQAAEFQVNFPATIVTTQTITNPEISVGLGTLTGGISVAFFTCHYDWVYTHHLTCLAIGATPGAIQLAGDSSVHPPLFVIATCEEGFPYGTLVYLNALAVFQPCVIGTQSSSWGAIKNLF